MNSGLDRPGRFERNSGTDLRHRSGRGRSLFRLLRHAHCRRDGELLGHLRRQDRGRPHRRQPQGEVTKPRLPADSPSAGFLPNKRAACFRAGGSLLLDLSQSAILLIRPVVLSIRNFMMSPATMCSATVTAVFRSTANHSVGR